MSYPVAKLQAVMRGQDQSIPMLAAMAAFEIKGPMEIAAKAEQAKQKQSTVSVRDKLAREGREEQNGMLPDNLMMAMQQQQQGSLPENTGIGQLPAPNMQTMSAANGGIIAFDDGGYVPGYAEGDLIGDEYVSDRPPMSYSEQMGNVGDLMFRGVKRLFNAPLTEDEKEAERKRKKEDKSKPYPVSKAKRAATESKPYPADAKPKAVDPTAGQAVTDANANPGYVPSNAPQLLPPRPEDRETKTSAGTTKTGIATIGKEPTLEPYKSQSIKDISADINSAFGVDKLATGANELGGILEKGATEARARFEKRPKYTPYEKYERSLKTEEENAAQDKKDAFQMALVNAGLGIAAGSSQYALQNIAEGAMVGTKQYMSAMKDLKAAAKERQKAFAMIDEARGAKADKDFDRAEALEDRILGHKVKAKELSIDALSKSLQITVPQATALFNKQAELQERDKQVRYEQQMENQRSRERNATTLAAYDKMAGNRGGGEYNIAWDNAKTVMDNQIKANPMLMLEYQKNPQRYQTDFNALLQQALNKSTTTGGATMPGGGNLKFLGFEKQ